MLTAMLRNKNYHNLADNPNITVHDGEASFISGNAVSVKLANGDSLELTSEHIFINTGARSIIPAIDGVTDSKRVYTSTTIMQLEELPKRLAVIGGGYIGLEFASMMPDSVRKLPCWITMPTSSRKKTATWLQPSRPYWKRKASNSA